MCILVDRHHGTGRIDQFEVVLVGGAILSDVLKIFNGDGIGAIVIIDNFEIVIIQRNLFVKRSALAHALEIEVLVKVLCRDVRTCQRIVLVGVVHLERKVRQSNRQIIVFVRRRIPVMGVAFSGLGEMLDGGIGDLGAVRIEFRNRVVVQIGVTGRLFSSR